MNPPGSVDDAKRRQYDDIMLTVRAFVASTILFELPMLYSLSAPSPRFHLGAGSVGSGPLPLLRHLQY